MNREHARRTRLLVAACVAVLVSAFSAYRNVDPLRSLRSDLALQLLATRVFWAGLDPYAAVGPGRAVEAPAPPLYPATALVVLRPLTATSTRLASIVFASALAGVFAYATTRSSWVPLTALLSWPYFLAADSPQWSPLLAAAAVCPALGWAVAIKPNLGLAAAAYDLRWGRPFFMLAGIALLLAVSLAVQPNWPSAWLRAIESAPLDRRLGNAFAMDLYKVPARAPGGWLALAALARWRRPEARLLVVLACVPQTPTGYELVPILALVPRTRIEGLVLAMTSWAMPALMFSGRAYANLRQAFDAYADWSVWCVFMPAVILVLRRPNEGPMPRWIDVGIERVRSRWRRPWRVDGLGGGS